MLRDLELAWARTLSPEAREGILSFLDLLAHWGQRMNLTADPNPVVVLTRQVPDAFAVAAVLDAVPDLVGRAVDVGAGAGLPSIPLQFLVPALHLTLVEPMPRRCAFMRQVRQALALPYDVVQGTLRDLPEASFRLYLSRATWAPARWLNETAPLTRPGVGVLVFVGQSGDAPPPPANLLLALRRDYLLPDGTPRSLLLYRATGPRA